MSGRWRCLWLAAAVAALTASAVAASQTTAAPELDVSVDPRVELMSIIFRLAGNPEYQKARLPAYAAAVDSWFAPVRNHAVVRLAAALRAERGVSFDAPMTMAVHVRDALCLEEAVPLEPWPSGLDQRWGPEGARSFLAAARDFVEQSRYRDFLASQVDYHRSAASALRAPLEGHARLPWFASFFGAPSKVRFHLIFGLLTGPCCYGPSLRTAAGDDVYCVLGAWAADEHGAPQVGLDEVLPTVAHEFCHSFANPLVERHRPALAPAGERIFAAVEASMRRAAYGDWLTMQRESLVRACSLRYVQARSGAEAVEREARVDAELGFSWTGDLARLLGEYEARRAEFPDLDAFMPRVVRFFDDLAPRVVERMARLRERQPRVLELQPPDRATDVDPGLTELRVTFDRPMKDGSWAVCSDGPTAPPASGKPHYDQARRVFTLPVKLEPDRTYRCSINSQRFHGFQSEDGVPAEPVTLSFTTRSR